MEEEILIKKSKYSDAQIMAILKQAENGVPVSDLCREHGMSSANFYKWRSKYGGMEVLRLFGQRGGTAVKALLHDPDKAASVTALGIQPVVGAFEDHKTLTTALDGIETVVLISAANPFAEVQASNVIATAKMTGAENIVRVSAVTADPVGRTINTRTHGMILSGISKSGLNSVFWRAPRPSATTQHGQSTGT